MYPTVCRLLGVWDLLIAKRIDVDEDASVEVQTLLDGLTTEDCFRPGFWRNLVGIAQIVPDGDVLPVRARYGESLS